MRDKIWEILSIFTVWSTIELAVFQDVLSFIFLPVCFCSLCFWATAGLSLFLSNSGPVIESFHACITRSAFEPSHEIMVLSVLRKLILQTHMRSHPVGLDVWFFVGPFVYFHTLCVQTLKALVRLRECAGLPEPSLVAYVISTISSWAGSF